MPQPTSNTIHVDRPLQNFAERFMNEQSDFVMMQAFPRLPVANRSDYYYKFDKRYWFSDEMQTRAPGDTFARSGYELTTGVYFAQQRALEHAIPDENRANADAGINLDQEAVEFVTTKNLLEQEIRIGAATLGSGIWSSSDASATNWDDSSGVPITAIQRAQRAVRDLTGRIPNAIVMGLIVEHALSTNAQIVEKVKYSQRALPEDIRAILAASLGLEFVFVSQASYNSAAEGEDASLAPIVDDDALVFYRPRTVGQKTATAALVLDWNGGGGIGTIERWRDESIKSDIVRVYSAYDIKVTAADLGYWLPDVA
jgi:hypothetical protein